MFKKIFYILPVLAFLFFVPASVFAQDAGLSLGAATPIVLKEKAADGDIITATKTGYYRSKVPYDPYIIGVISKNPTLYLEDQNLPNAVPLIRTGEVLLRVTTANGIIKKGDYVTSSAMPGVGQRSTDNGFVVGVAEEDYSEKDPKKVGMIYVAVNPHFVQQSNNVARNLGTTLNLTLLAVTSTPLGSLKYFIAGFIVLVSLYFGFNFFAKSSQAGVEAVGRNPLAKQAILLSVVLNVLITFTVILFGVGIAYLILIL